MHRAATAKRTNNRRGQTRARFVVVEEDVLVFHERYQVQRLRGVPAGHPGLGGLPIKRRTE